MLRIGIGDEIYQDKDFISIIKPLLRHPKVQEMRKYRCHGYVDCLTHSVYVSYTAYCIGRLLGWNYKGLATAGMLHDLYLYDWHIKGGRKGLHGFTHAREALKNAREVKRLTKGERDIIETHMWPLNPKFPKYRESFVFMLSDRYCTILESLHLVPVQPRFYDFGAAS